MSLSYPHPGEPYRQTGVKLGDGSPWALEERTPAG